VVLPAVSIVRTDSVPVPDDKVTPLALNVLPTGVASTQVEPSALTCSFSPAPRLPVNVPLTVCAATLVMKSLPELPLSEDSVVTVPTAVGATVPRVSESPAPLAVLPAVSVALIDTVIGPSESVDRSALPAPLPVTCTVTVLVPSLNFTSALASASSPATVNASVVFSALLTRWSLTVTAGLPPASAVVSRVRGAPVPAAVTAASSL